MPGITSPPPNAAANTSYSMLFSPAASSLASTSGGGLNNLPSTPLVDPQQQSQPPLQLEIHWEPSLVKAELIQASAILSHRCLKLAAKWAAEQLVGIPVGQPASLQEENDPEELESGLDPKPPAAASPCVQNVLQEELLNMTEQDWYAKSLVELGQYLHAAAVLSQESGSSGNDNNDDDDNDGRNAAINRADITQIGPPQSNLSSYGIYLRAYALYMAGERRKEEEYAGLESAGQHKKAAPRNSYLQQLIDEVSESYNNGDLDAFGAYVYGLILKEGRKESLVCPHAPHNILVESLLDFPLNWSAWLDLCEVVAREDISVEQQVEQALQPALVTHYMYHFFCAHLMAHYHHAHDDAQVLFERLYEPLPQQPLFQSAHVKTQLAVVHYHMRAFDTALQWFEEALVKQQDRYNLDFKDVYSNILYVREDRASLSHLAHEAVVVDKYRPETCCIIGNYYSAKQQRHKAVLYFQRALKLDHTYTAAWTLMGHEYVELKQPEQAMESYRCAVDVTPRDYRAWYGLGQTYEFLNMHLYALFYFKKAAMLRQYDARMWCAVGSCFAALHKIPDAIRAYERAVANDDAEGIATQKLAALYCQVQDKEKAAQCYLRHLELRYLVTSLAPAMNPTLDEIVQGIALEAVEAEALLFLAQYHRTNGQFDVATLLCSRLMEYPGPEKEHAKGLLRELRSQGQRTSRATAGTRGDASTHPPFQFSP
jgi:anaphase-promoting complex subunit 8